MFFTVHIISYSDTSPNQDSNYFDRGHGVTSAGGPQPPEPLGGWKRDLGAFPEKGSWGVYFGGMGVYLGG